MVSSEGNIKVVGANGQISLGKQFAGTTVLVEEREPGVWLVRAATVIPDNERWLHQPAAAADLRRALDWSQSHPAAESRLEDLSKELNEAA